MSHRRARRVFDQQWSRLNNQHDYSNRVVEICPHIRVADCLPARVPTSGTVDEDEVISIRRFNIQAERRLEALQGEQDGYVCL